MKRKAFTFSIRLFLFFGSPSLVYALPHHQVYINEPEVKAMTVGEDENAWFYNELPGPVRFNVVITFRPNDTPATNITLHCF
jgi:hypothetical protein